MPQPRIKTLLPILLTYSPLASPGEYVNIEKSGQKGENSCNITFKLSRISSKYYYICPDERTIA